MKNKKAPLRNILVPVLLVLIVCVGAYIKADKHHFCAEYALNSYGHSMAGSEDKVRAYDEAHQRCNGAYLKVRASELLDRL